MFQNDIQRGLVCQIITTRLRGEWWVLDPKIDDAPRPTQRAIDALGACEELGADAQPWEEVVLRLAWDIWNGSGHARMGDVLTVLDSGQRTQFAALIMAHAQSPGAVTAWLADAEL